MQFFIYENIKELLFFKNIVVLIFKIFINYLSVLINYLIY